MVYCLEEADNGKDLNLLTLADGAVPGDVRFEKTEIAGRKTVALLAQGRRGWKVQRKMCFFNFQSSFIDYACTVIRNRT